MTDKANGKVISLSQRLELRQVAQNIRMGMIYQAFIEDANTLTPKDDKGYFGLVYSIPGEEKPDTLQPFEMDQNQLSMMIDIDEDGEYFPCEGKGVERYEIHDMATDDIHVMYRVPYRNHALKAVPKPPEPE